LVNEIEERLEVEVVWDKRVGEGKGNEKRGGMKIRMS
jgi:hypothetical protein